MSANLAAVRARLSEASGRDMLASTSMYTSLAWLRSLRVPCADALHIAPGTPLFGSDGVELTLRVFYREHEHLGGHALLVAYDDGAALDNDADEERSCITICGGGDDLHLQHRVLELMSAAPERAVCVRHSAANGRIGLMLRRMPPLIVTVRCEPASPATVERIALAGSTAPPILPKPLFGEDDEDDEDESPIQARDLSEASSGAELAHHAVETSDDEWARQVSWSLAKVYCCRGPGARYNSLLDDQDDWTKVVWAADDGMRIMRAASAAATALMTHSGKASASVHVALECVFGSAAQRGGGGEVNVRSTAVVPASAAKEGMVQGELRDIVVTWARIDQQWQPACSNSQDQGTGQFE